MILSIEYGLCKKGNSAVFRNILNYRVQWSIINFFQFICDHCHKTFGRKYNYKRHLRVHSEKVVNLKCSKCPLTFANNSNLKIHFEKSHLEMKIEEKKSVLVHNKSSYNILIIYMKLDEILKV